MISVEFANVHLDQHVILAGDLNGGCIFLDPALAESLGFNTRRMHFLFMFVTSLGGLLLAYALDAATSDGVALFCGLAFVVVFFAQLLYRCFERRRRGRPPPSVVPRENV